MWLTEAAGFCCYLWKYGNINFTEKIELPSYNCSRLSSLLNKVNCEADMRRDWHSLVWCYSESLKEEREEEDQPPGQQTWSYGGGDLTWPDLTRTMMKLLTLTSLIPLFLPSFTRSAQSGKPWLPSSLHGPPVFVWNPQPGPAWSLDGKFLNTELLTTSAPPQVAFKLSSQFYLGNVWLQCRQSGWLSELLIRNWWRHCTTTTIVLRSQILQRFFNQPIIGWNTIAVSPVISCSVDWLTDWLTVWSN